MAIGTSRDAELADVHFVYRTRRRTAVRLLPFLFILYIANFLDRTSVSYAAIGMSRDLGFSDSVFGFGVGVFFIGYLALQIPGALLVERWSARKSHLRLHGSVGLSNGADGACAYSEPTLFRALLPRNCGG